MGIALLTLAGLRQFSRLGLDTALIQRKEDNVDEYLNTAWSMKAIRGVAITGVAFVLAPYAAQFFSEPRATDIIRVIALSPLITGSQNPGVMYLRKNLEFHKQFVYTLSSTVTNVTVTIGAAIVLQNVWALVFGSLAGNITTVIVSYIIHGYRPVPEFNTPIAKELLGFGKWVWGSRFISFLMDQGDDALVGRLLTANALGLYQMSYRISNAPATEVSQVISSVLLPTYSNLQSNIDQLRRAYLRSLKMTTVISFFLASSILYFSYDFTYYILGKQWVRMVPAMQIMALLGLIRSIGATLGPLFNAMGRPDIDTKLTIIKLVIFTVTVYPLISQFGIAGAALATVIHPVIVNPIADWQAIKLLNCAPWEFARLILYPALISIVTYSIIFTIDFITLGDSFGTFLITAAFAILLYPVVTYAVEQITTYDVSTELRFIHNNLT